MPARFFEAAGHYSISSSHLQLVGLLSDTLIIVLPGGQLFPWSDTFLDAYTF